MEFIGNKENKYGVIWKNEGKAFQVINIENFMKHFLSRNKHDYVTI